MTTRVQRPRVTEGNFQASVTQLAETLGWDWVHVERRTVSRTGRSGVPRTYVETPTKGTLGNGWVDLLLVRERVVFAELKGDGGRLEEDQKHVRDRLLSHSQEWYVWGPRDWDQVVAVLSRRAG